MRISVRTCTQRSRQQTLRRCSGCGSSAATSTARLCRRCSAGDTRRDRWVSTRRTRPVTSTALNRLSSPLFSPRTHSPGHNPCISSPLPSPSPCINSPLPSPSISSPLPSPSPCINSPLPSPSISSPLPSPSPSMNSPLPSLSTVALPPVSLTIRTVSSTQLPLPPRRRVLV